MRKNNDFDNTITKYMHCFHQKKKNALHLFETKKSNGTVEDLAYVGTPLVTPLTASEDKKFGFCYMFSTVQVDQNLYKINKK